MAQGLCHKNHIGYRARLKVLTALQMDGEWLLGLSEADQLTVAQATSAQDAGVALSETVLGELQDSSLEVRGERPPVFSSCRPPSQRQ